jgi:hypothetical protein
LFLEDQLSKAGSGTSIGQQSTNSYEMLPRLTSTSLRKSRAEMAEMSNRRNILVVDDEAQITRVRRAAGAFKGVHQPSAKET